MTIIDTSAKLHSMVILETGNTLVTATNIDDIIKHFRGGLPVNHSIRTIYDNKPITYDDAMRLADQHCFDHIESHVNLI